MVDPHDWANERSMRKLRLYGGHRLARCRRWPIEYQRNVTIPTLETIPTCER